MAAKRDRPDKSFNYIFHEKDTTHYTLSKSLPAVIAHT